MSIYAEGINGKGRDWKENILKSVSVEFECIDRIYEANIKSGTIKDADGDFSWFIEKLICENEIVVIGTGILSLNVFDMLFSYGIDIFCFMSKDEGEQRHRLFGKKVLSEGEVKKNTKCPIFLECCAENSAWGFGEVDKWDYYGYQRNCSYFLVKDYTDILVGNLRNILRGRNIVLIGNHNLCCNVSHVLETVEECRITYCDLLEEESAKEIRLEITDSKNITDDDVCFIIEPPYICDVEHMREINRKKKLYIEKIEDRKIINITNYFSNFEVLISIQKNDSGKYTVPCLTPGKILLNISGHMSGNIFFSSLLDGHPDILLINSGVGIHLIIDNLILFCLQMAEENAENILQTFWDIYNSISMREDELLLIYKEIFNDKFRELLTYKDCFTPQELFIIIHMVYEKIFGRDISDVQEMLLYYEPRSEVGIGRLNYEKWLSDEKVKGFSILITRNSYIRAGSYFKFLERFQNFFYPKVNDIWRHMVYIDENTKKPDYWFRIRVKFEMIKTEPRKILEYICKELELSWTDILLETTTRGEMRNYSSGNDIITGFDLRPVYNLYEEYFSDFDRFRIDMVFSVLQRGYGYPYVSCRNFSRRQLQDMFLKEFRFEDRLVYENDYWRKRYHKDLVDKMEEYLQKARLEEVYIDFLKE